MGELLQNYNSTVPGVCIVPVQCTVTLITRCDRKEGVHFTQSREGQVEGRGTMMQCKAGRAGTWVLAAGQMT